MLVAMHVMALLTTAMAVSSVRAELADAEEQVLTHAWQVEQMMPTNEV